jgi:hypothetical protein
MLYVFLLWAFLQIFRIEALRFDRINRISQICFLPFRKKGRKQDPAPPEQEVAKAPSRRPQKA